MSALQLILPLALAAYFVFMGARSRIFLLGIPFLMFMRSSVFFENARIFWAPGRFDPDTLMLMWLFIVWAVCLDLVIRPRRGGRRRLFGPAFSLPEEGLLLAAAAYAALQVALTTVRYGDAGAALGEAQGFAYLFIGYFLIRGIVGTASLAQLLAFVRVLVIINTGAALLFVLHQGLGLGIYSGGEYYTTSFMGVTITRTFYFMPQLLGLSIAYIFSRRQWNAWWVIAAILNLAAVWFSYTRSLLLIAVVIIAVSLVARAFKRSQARLVVRRTVAIVAVLGVLAFGFTRFLPVQSEYFVSRLAEATGATSVGEVANVQNRERKLQVTYAGIAKSDAALGAGFVSAAEDPFADQVREMQSDIVWVPILYRLGLLGVALWVALFVGYAWRAARLAASHAKDVELFGIVLLGVVVGLFLQGFVSWTLMQPGRFALALWAFAFIGATAGAARALPAARDDGEGAAS